MPKDANGLTLRASRFVDGIVEGLNVTQAAIRAGFSERTAYSQGSRLLKNVEVQRVLHAARQKVSANAGATLAGHLAQLERIRNAALAGEDFKAAAVAEIAYGKHSGVALPEKQEHAGPHGGPIPLQAWSFGKRRVAF